MPSAGATAQERQKLLSFVVVGGGPTGVEVAAELHDMVRDDLVKVRGAARCVSIRAAAGLHARRKGTAVPSAPPAAHCMFTHHLT